MFKVISKTNLIQNVPIVKIDGSESVACIPPRGFIFTRRITPALQYLIDNRQVSIVETNEHLKPSNSDNVDSSDNRVDSGSFTETINITEFNSEEEKVTVQSSELESLIDISNVEESVNNPTKPKRGRRKKTDGDNS